MQTLNDYIIDLSNEMTVRTALLQQPQSPPPSATDAPHGGLHIVVPTAGGERHPITLACIRTIAEEVTRTRTPIHLLLANFKADHREQQEMMEAANGLKLPARMIQVPPKIRSAGYSFNEGLHAVMARLGDHPEERWPVAKLDDDSLLTPGVTGRMRAVLARGWNMASPLIARTERMEDLLDPTQRDTYVQRFNTSGQEPDVREIWPESLRLDDGSLDLGTLMASWQFRRERLTNTENLMMMDYPTAWRFNEAGGAFIPRRYTGEGVEFHLQAQRMGLRQCYVRNSYVIDRPDTLPSQTMAYGVDDAVFALMLDRAGLLPKGLQCVTGLNDGMVVRVNVPEADASGRRGTLVLPEQIDEALGRLSKEGVRPEEMQPVVSGIVQAMNGRGQQTPDIMVWQLLERIQTGIAIGRGISETVRRLMPPDARPGSRLTLENGWSVVVPFEGKLDRPFIGSTAQARGSVYHTLGCALGSLHEPDFVMTQH